ncbi:MAG: 2OG-Fe(II) oxygenase [Fulvivirga sp.]|uniref:2OG-Fe(II) oxygenase n=1 Tax=Fulvivirga sp. TaxID=1931237 RepID=UPI0032EFDC4D
MNNVNEHLLEQIADQLATSDYAIIDDFLSTEQVEAILNVFDIHREKGRFKQAAIGASVNQEVDKSVRKDLIKWIDEDNARPAVQEFLSKIDEVKNYLNRTCFLGIKEYEAHFTIYPPGAFYKRHLDQFTTSDHRKISFICYLNQDWKPEHGGELRLYLPDGNIDVAPIAGRLACFRSDVVEHEVLLSHAHRYSLTGWMLDQYIELSFLG